MLDSGLLAHSVSPIRRVVEKPDIDMWPNHAVNAAGDGFLCQWPLGDISGWTGY